MSTSTPRIFFNRFWPGFLEYTNPNTVKFFCALFSTVFGKNIIIEHDMSKANILCEHVCPPSNTLIYQKEWQYSILVTGESVVSDIMHDHYSKFSCFLSGLTTNYELKHVTWPLFTSYIYCNHHLQMPPVSTMPDKMVCAIIANPKGTVRNKFLDKLAKHVHVVYGGSFRNNLGYRIGGDHNSKELLQFMRQFKFVIAMENNEEDHYITEKICNPLFAGVIPVYWGSPNVTTYFNSNRILHLKKDSDAEMDSIIDSMLHMDATEYNRKVNTPLLINMNLIDPIATEIKRLLF